MLSCSLVKAAKGQVRGSTIALDNPLPSLDGKRVRLLVEEAEPDEEKNEDKMSSEMHRQWWIEWAAQGPQGPIEEDEQEPSFP